MKHEQNEIKNQEQFDLISNVHCIRIRWQKMRKRKKERKKQQQQKVENSQL